MYLTFEYPWLLALLVILPGAVVVWRRSQSGSGAARRRLSLAVRLAVLTLLVLGLAGATWRPLVDRQSVVFVGDLSASTAKLRGEAEGWLHRALAARSQDDAAAVVVVGREALVERPLARDTRFARFESTPNVDFTNLADGLRLAGALLPPESRRRVVLLSDGRPNLGDAQEQARLLRARGITLDVVPLAPSVGPEALIKGIAAPSALREGERFDLRVSMASGEPTPAMLRLYVDDRLLGEQRVTLRGGREEFVFGGLAPPAGFHTLRATLDAERDTIGQNNEAAAFVAVQGPPRVLLVEGQAGNVASLAAALRSTGVQAEIRAPGALPVTLEELGRFGSVVLVDVPADVLGDRAMALLQSYVRDLGHGLVTVGGESSYGLGGYKGTPLEETLPVSSDVRGRKEQGQLALVLVIDRSGSMAEDLSGEGVPKIAMAREAALRATQELEDNDYLGVLAFDSAQQWIVLLRRAAEGGGLKEARMQIARLEANGGTDIFPALAAAYEALAPIEAKYRHIILLSDGMSCCGGDYGGLIARAIAEKITISTIAVGADADAGLLRALAGLGEGRFYFTQRARDIPKIMTKETRLASRTATVEQPITPRVSAPSPLLQPLLAEGVPILDGYVVAAAKDTAQVALASDLGDPLLAQWQYGLGRAVAWTSDGQGRWTADWLRWPGFGRWWSGVVAWTLPAESGGLQLEATATPGRGHLVVLTPVAGKEPAEMIARVVGPDLVTAEVALRPTAPGRYEATFDAARQGAYMLRVVERQGEQVVRESSGGMIVPYSPEYRELGGDAQLMVRLADLGGGRALQRPEEAFARNLPPVYGSAPLWPALLALVALLLPLDVAVRRLAIGPADCRRWISARRIRRAHEAQVAPSPMLAGLQARRERVRGRLERASSVPHGAVPPSPSCADFPAASTPPCSPAPIARQAPSIASADEETHTERLLRARRKGRKG